MVAAEDLSREKDVVEAKNLADLVHHIAVALQSLDKLQDFRDRKRKLC